ncbi:hypothetical protein PILCRDRAFT_111279 [Piloderma croceum F 1598]|uniref:Uncharacterized protein n=1 Tax=Piloderma croceum (strain F 1598) TaxID=765440 RepID=A0A0C3G767_PILCF|nr:hypothetical protein PILCRDRAFT_111279 [Piloderma croceum F 1598]
MQKRRRLVHHICVRRSIFVAGIRSMACDSKGLAEEGMACQNCAEVKCNIVTTGDLLQRIRESNGIISRLNWNYRIVVYESSTDMGYNP